MSNVSTSAPVAGEHTRGAAPVVRLALAAALVGAAVLAMFRAWADIWRIASRDEEASHILLVPIVVIWLVAARREQFERLRLSYSPVGPMLIALGWAVSWFGFYHSTQSFWHGGAVLMAIGAAVAVLGTDMIRRFWPAFVVLGLLVPVPGTIRQQLALPMQTVTAALAQHAGEIFGMVVVRHGNVLHYNGQDIAVAEACNGMRMVFALLLVSFAYAFATPLKTWVRVMIVLLSPLLAVVCNVIRLVPTVYVYGHYSTETAEQFHDLSGWTMVFVALGLLMGIVAALRWAQVPVDADDRDERGREPEAARSRAAAAQEAG